MQTENVKKEDNFSEKNSIEFEWNTRDFENLLNTCDKDDSVELTLKYLKNKDSKILEAGCGLGRVVKYLYDLGYKNIKGIELDKSSVAWLNQQHPYLNIKQGDVLELPYEKNSFDVVLSYGVIEHFPDGPYDPMKAMYDILKPGGLGIITVPSFNIVRRIQYCLNFFDVRKINFIRKIFGKNILLRNDKFNNWYVDPQYGKFFEYRFTPRQFRYICKKSGFKIIKSYPISHVDGLFHCFGQKFVTFKNWAFHVTPFGKVLNSIFSCIPYFHNHMHLCVVKKDD